MIVVGGKNSSNTKELAVKCAEIQPETVHVADADELATEHADLAGGARLASASPVAPRRPRSTSRRSATASTRSPPRDGRSHRRRAAHFGSTRRRSMQPSPRPMRWRDGGGRICRTRPTPWTVGRGGRLRDPIGCRGHRGARRLRRSSIRRLDPHDVASGWMRIVRPSPRSVRHRLRAGRRRARSCRCHARRCSRTPTICARAGSTSLARLARRVLVNASTGLRSSPRRARGSARRACGGVCR